MDSLLFKNIGSSALEVVDLGIYLEVDEEIDLLVNYRNGRYTRIKVILKEQCQMVDK